MKKLLIGACALAVVVMAAAPALAHVTVQPNEAIAGSFSRFVVRVPNERPDASTTEVTVELPPLAFVSFEPKDGWDRDVEEGEFDEPIEAFGDELTEGVLSVTWSGGEVKPGEFVEFGFSARMPDGEETLEFAATQTYDSGEVVEWTGAEDSETPAARVTIYDLGGAETGQLGVLDGLADAAGGGGDTGTDTGTDAESDPGDMTAASEADEDSEDTDVLPLIVGGAGFVLGTVALIVALGLRRSTS